MHRSIHQSCYNHLKRENGTLLNIHRLGKFLKKNSIEILDT